MSATDRATTVTLRALDGQPLERQPTREMVEATARAIAERQGVALLELRLRPDRVIATLQAGRIEAIGFAAELRRVTTNWYRKKFGVDELWGRAADDDDLRDAWKQP